MFHALVTRHSDTQFEVDDYEWAELDMSVPSHRPVSTLHSVQSVSVSEWWRGNITVLWLWVDVSVEVDRIDSYKRKSGTFFEYIILRRRQLQFRYWTFHCLPSVFCFGLVRLSWSVFACVLIFICLLWSSRLKSLRPWRRRAVSPVNSKIVRRADRPVHHKSYAGRIRPVNSKIMRRAVRPVHHISYAGRSALLPAKWCGGRTVPEVHRSHATY